MQNSCSALTRSIIIKRRGCMVYVVKGCFTWLHCETSVSFKLVYPSRDGRKCSSVSSCELTNVTRLRSVPQWI